MKNIRKNKLLRTIYGWFTPRGEGAWLFYQPTVEWMYDRDLRAQLPAPLRAFSAYCRAQRLWGAVIGGDIAFRAATSFSRASEVHLEREGLHIFLSLNDPRMLNVPKEVFGRSLVANAIREHLGPGDTFVDVGANHGSFSAIASRLVGADGLVVAVEPQADLARLVEQALRLNSMGRFEVHNLALGNERGTVQLYCPNASSGIASVFDGYARDGDRRVVDVECVTLDDLLAETDPPGNVLLKVDIEGSEVALLEGAEKTLARLSPTILIEVNRRAIRAAGETTETLVDLLRKYGYRTATELGEQVKQPLAVMVEHEMTNFVIER